MCEGEEMVLEETVRELSITTPTVRLLTYHNTIYTSQSVSLI